MKPGNRCVKELRVGPGFTSGLPENFEGFQRRTLAIIAINGRG
jgi:hypothetical protein